MTANWRTRTICIVSLLLLTACTAKALLPQVSGAWARPGGQGMNSAVYFTLQNSAIDDVLLDARSEVAEVVQLHRTVIDANGSAGMQHQEQIELMGHQVLEFAPGGLHIMLIHLRQSLAAGDTFELNLIFLEQGEVRVQVPVEAN